MFDYEIQIARSFNCVPRSLCVEPAPKHVVYAEITVADSGVAFSEVQKLQFG